MKKIIFILICLLTIVTFSSCRSTPKVDNMDNNDDRFVIVFNEGLNRIYTDTETGVMYFYHMNGYGGGLSVMLDTDGKPLIWNK